jgi:hypothetical protein
LYVDHIDNLIGWASVEGILEEAKKHHIGFVGSAKTMQYVPEIRRSDVINSFGTIAAFGMERDDAEVLAPRLLRLDADKIRRHNLSAADQEKLHIERLMQQEPGQYFVFRVGQSAGVIDAQSPEYPFS